MNRSIPSPFRARALALALGLLAAPAGAAPAKKEAAPPWLGEELPLPLAVRTPGDLAIKALAERQYLVFNLLAGGKLAWDRGDFETAAQKWDALLKIPGLDPELEQTLRPLLAEAHAKSGRPRALAASPTPAPERPVAPSLPERTADATRPARTPPVTVSGKVVGGGATGPGGTVVWLKRTDGPTPTPAPGRARLLNQANKTFLPHILPITVGTKVEFHNQDDIFHNVFSLSRPNDFDAGLYKGGESYDRVFTSPGPVQILCNIHSSMLAYVVVVDTPYYGLADASGSFTMKNVPPGAYRLEAWHEGSAGLARLDLTVGPEPTRGLVVRVTGDRGRPNTLPDKYGKPRQAQLGY